MTLPSPRPHAASASSGSTGLLELFHQLHQAHARLLGAIAEMAEATSEPTPDRLRYTQARMRLSQASVVRRTIVTGAIRQLLQFAAPADAEAVLSLQASGLAMLRISSAHVGQWTIETIERNWPSYCAASADLRLKMKAQIDAEKRILYPLLKKEPLR